MVIVKLMGGMGNQLFQYAAGKALAIKHSTSLKLDLSFLNADPLGQHTQRSLALDAFKLDYEICTPAEQKQFTHPAFFNKIFKTHFVANEKGFEFNEDFFSYPENTYLNGFWQSEKYFANIRDLLLTELEPKNKMTDAGEAVKTSILQSNAVSLHIRRGDYVTNKNAQAYHGNLPLDYYHAAVAHLTGLYGNLKFFIFSDDIPWVKANLRPANDCVYIDFNTGDKSVFDLYLMSLCRHHIIANSSFSWWGAWLNRHKDKTVIAPRYWFKNQGLNTKDLIPAAWIML